jgi:hypothetical protein
LGPAPVLAHVLDLDFLDDGLRFLRVGDFLDCDLLVFFARFWTFVIALVSTS